MSSALESRIRQFQQQRDKSGSAPAPQSPKIRSLSDAMGSASRMVLAGAPKNPVRTGFPDVDAGMKNLGPGEITMLAAVGGVGKSTVSMQMALHAAASGHGVAYFNLEMAEDMFGLRTMANYAGVSTSRVADGTASETEYKNFWDRSREIAPVAKYIGLGDRSRHTTMPAIRDFCTAVQGSLVESHRELKLIVIDHVMCVKTNVRSDDKDGAGMARADFLKELAESFKCHVLSLIHINREGSKSGKMPSKEQLASSAWFDRHADNTLIFHQERTEQQTFIEGKPAVLACQKARWGSPFSVELEYRAGFFWPWRLT